MPATCPHCHRPAIAYRRKLCAVDAYPARCPACGGLSHVGANLRYMVLLCVPELIAIALLSAWSASLLLGLLGAILMLGVFAAYHRLAPLVPITARAVRLSRGWYVIGWLAIIGLIVWVAQHPLGDGL